MRSFLCETNSSFFLGIKVGDAFAPFSSHLLLFSENKKVKVNNSSLHKNVSLSLFLVFSAFVKEIEKEKPVKKGQVIKGLTFFYFLEHFPLSCMLQSTSFFLLLSPLFLCVSVLLPFPSALAPEKERRLLPISLGKNPSGYRYIHPSVRPSNSLFLYDPGKDERKNAALDITAKADAATEQTPTFYFSHILFFFSRGENLRKFFKDLLDAPWQQPSLSPLFFPA